VSQFIQWLKDHHSAILATTVILQNVGGPKGHILSAIGNFVETLVQ